MALNHIVTLFVPVKTISEANRGFSNWRARKGRKDKQRAAVKAEWDACAQDVARFKPPVVVTFVRLSAGVLDTDNLCSALKFVRDEVAACLGVDDGDTKSASWCYAQERCKRNQHGVKISIEQL